MAGALQVRAQRRGVVTTQGDPANEAARQARATPIGDRLTHAEVGLTISRQSIEGLKDQPEVRLGDGVLSHPLESDAVDLDQVVEALERRRGAAPPHEHHAGWAQDKSDDEPDGINGIRAASHQQAEAKRQAMGGARHARPRVARSMPPPSPSATSRTCRRCASETGQLSSARDHSLSAGPDR
jgi:hypothetical protein